MNRVARISLREIYFLSMPLHAWKIRGREVRRSYRELKSSEYASTIELESLRNQRLRELVRFSYDNCAFYQESFKSAGLSPDDVQVVADLSKLPLLTKSDVRQNLLHGLRPRNFDELQPLKIVTSGSTGEPFTIFASREQLEIRFASTLRALEMTGWQFGDRQARLWHQTLGMSKSQVFRERFDAWLLRRKFIPAFEINPRNINHFINTLEKHNPVLLDGYAESLNFLASYLRAGGQPKISPKAVMSSAQALPKATREAIETSLQTRVFDKYGSREFSGIAYECGEGLGHHVVDECYIVEILVDGRPALPGETGEVVVTDLFNYATPLIRYRIGDLATLPLSFNERCTCGRPHSRIGDIQGRTQAIVHCADGTWIPGTFFAHFFKDFEDTIRLFQIYQEQKGEFKLRIVKSDLFRHEKLDSILKQLRRYVGSTSVLVEFVDEIPLVRTGKRSPVVSDVAYDFQEISSDQMMRESD